MNGKIALLLGTAVAVATLAACSDGSGGATEENGEGVRTIEISAFDDLRFEPAEIEVAAGEVVRFVVTNEGELKHEFILGAEETQMMHEGEMGEGGSMEHGGSELPAISLAAGETREATVTFDEPGTVLFGCHVPGHYDAGMVGTVTVG